MDPKLSELLKLGVPRVVGGRCIEPNWGKDNGSWGLKKERLEVALEDALEDALEEALEVRGVQVGPWLGWEAEACC